MPRTKRKIIVGLTPKGVRVFRQVPDHGSPKTDDLIAHMVISSSGNPEKSRKAREFLNSAKQML